MLTGEMCFKVKWYSVCMNKLELVDDVLLFVTLLPKGQMNEKSKIVFN